jgi:hypothetical protein
MALVAWGGLFEGKRWAAWLEVARHLFGVLIGMLLIAAGYGDAPSWAARGVAVVSVAWVLWAKGRSGIRSAQLSR